MLAKSVSLHKCLDQSIVILYLLRVLKTWNNKMKKALGDQSYTKTKIISLVKSFLKFLGVNGKLCKSVDTTEV